MTRLNRIILFSAVLLLALSGTRLWAESNTNGIKSVTAITEVFGDGQQVTAVAIEYKQNIKRSSLSTATYSIKEVVPAGALSDGGRPRANSDSPSYNDRVVTKVYTNDAPETSEKGVEGRYVIVELEHIYHYLASYNGGPHGGGSGNGPRQGGPGAGGPMGGGPGGNNVSGKEKLASSYKGITSAPFLSVLLTQNKDIKTASGKKVKASAERASDRTVNLVVDDFIQEEFNDPACGVSIAYNLFIPKDYTPGTKYPLVLFIPDATVLGKETTRTLTQGIGATIWASPEEQAKRPCFVLAPDYTTVIGGENDDKTEDWNMIMTVNLVKSLLEKYSIDSDRLYTTGQSFGCIMSFAMDDYYPDLFAASLLVAGQYDSTRVDNFVNDKMLMMCGDGDFKAYPGMTGITNALKKLGVGVSITRWSARKSPEEQSALLRNLENEGNDIMFVHFDQYSVFPDDEHIDGMEHLQTWRVAYYIEEARAWLFRQRKSEPSRSNHGENPIAWGHIKSVTGIGKVFGDGMKLAAAVVEFDTVISGSSLSKETFILDIDNPVRRVYANDALEIAETGKDGRYAVIEFDTDGWLPVKDTIPENREFSGRPGGPGVGQQSRINTRITISGVTETSGPGREPLEELLAERGNPDSHPSLKYSTRHGGVSGYTFSVIQARDVKALSGEVLKADPQKVDNKNDISLVIDGFAKPDYYDPITGKTIKFNAFVPFGYDPDKSYPLVIYLHDEYAAWNRHDEPLIMGTGPGIWASDEFQELNGCFVLVPIVAHTFYKVGTLEETNLDAAFNLADRMGELFNIDKDRVYLVGQGVGVGEALASVEAYPGKFSAVLGVIPEADKTASAAAFKNTDVLFLVSDGDPDGVSTASTFLSKARKAGIRTATLSTSLGTAGTDSSVNKFLSGNAGVKTLTFKAGSVVPEDFPQNAVNNKHFLWRQAYELDNVLGWLFDR